MSLITKHLKLFIDRKGLKVTNIEKEADLPNSTLSRPFKEGKSIKTDTLEKVLKLEHFECISLIWLLKGEGQMEIEDGGSQTTQIKEIELKYLSDILSNFFYFPADEQSEIKGIVTFYLEKIVSEIQDIISGEDKFKKDIETYKNDLKSFQMLAENRHENKMLKKKNENLEQKNRYLKEQLEQIRSNQS